MRETNNIQNKSSSHASNVVSHSFVKKIASRVSGLFTPLSNWNSNSSLNESADHDSNASIDQLYNNCNNNSSELISPITKKRKINSIHDGPCNNQSSSTPGVSNNQCGPIMGLNDIPCVSKISGIGNKYVCSAPPVSNVICPISSMYDISNIPGPSGIGNKRAVSSTPTINSSNKNVKEPHINVTDVVDICSESSDSTSGCSSLFPQSDGSAQFRHNVTAPVMSLSDLDGVVAAHGKKLPKIDLTFLNKRGPTFNTSILAPSNRNLSSSVCERSSSISPFYSGRTMYGGASAAGSSCLSTSSRTFSSKSAKSNLFSPLNSRTTMNILPSNKRSNRNQTMSAAAKKMLDTLEQYSTPILDARRMPVAENTNHNVRKDISSNHKRKRKLPSLDDTIPTSADLLKLKRRERIQNTTSVARSISLDLAATSASTGTNLASFARIDSSKRPADSDSSDSEELEYPLDIKTTKRQCTEKSKPTEDANKFDDRPSPVFAELSNSILNLPSKIDISLPVKPAADNESLKNIPARFQFSVPIVAENNLHSPKIDDRNKLIADSKLKKSIPESNHTITATESIVANSSATTGITSTTSFYKPPSDTWICKECTVRNNTISDTNCVSCNAPKESISKPPIPVIVSKSTTTNASSLESSTSSWGNLYKPPSDTWSCKECLVRNKISDTNCISCNALKDSVPPKSTSFGIPSSMKPENSEVSNSNTAAEGSSWGNLFKPSPSDTWSCKECFVTNKISDSNCVSCTTPKIPVQKNQMTNVLPQPPVSNCFSLGIPDLKKSSENENKFGFSTETTKPSFQFGIPSTLQSKLSDTEKLKDSISSTTEVDGSSTQFKFGSNLGTSPAAPAFKFGAISNPIATAAATTYAFGNTTTSAANTENVKPNFSFETPKSVPEKSTNFEVTTSSSISSTFNNNFMSTQKPQIANAFSNSSINTAFLPINNKQESNIFGSSPPKIGEISQFGSPLKPVNSQQLALSLSYNAIDSTDLRNKIERKATGEKNAFSIHSFNNNKPFSFENQPATSNAANKIPDSTQSLFGSTAKTESSNIFGLTNLNNNKLNFTLNSAANTNQPTATPFSLKTNQPATSNIFSANPKSAASTTENKFGGFSFTGSATTAAAASAPSSTFGFGTQNTPFNNGAVTAGHSVFGTPIQTPKPVPPPASTQPAMIFGSSNFSSSSSVSQLQPTLTFGDNTADKISSTGFQFNSTALQQQPAAPQPFGAANTFSFAPNSAMKAQNEPVFPTSNFSLFGMNNNVNPVQQQQMPQQMFDPTAPPIFNFTAGQTPTGFSAQPSVNNTNPMSGRRIKKAVRRSHAK